MTAPKELLNLIERFKSHIDSYKSSKYNETQVRQEFINPFFKALGWDVDNEAGYAEAYKDVIHEDAIKITGSTKAPDYSFRIGGTRKFFLEAKKPSVNIKEDTHPAYQLRRYAWSAGLPLSILTDFEEFAVYDCRIKPHKNDQASTARIMYLTFKDYEDKWEEIASVFARDAILKGSFDKFAESNKEKRGTTEVNEAFLKEIESWRELLARNLALRNESLSQRDLNYAVQSTIDRIIFLRIGEDRGLEKYGKLRKLADQKDIYAALCTIFQEADAKYNSGLFHFKKEKEITSPPDNLTLNLIIDDKPLKTILKTLYYPDSPYEFSVLSADILGQVYEQFLGKVIRLTKGHQAKVEEKPEVKKAGGVYYTPSYIVDYIVKHTVGELLECKKPEDVEKLKVLDPACGSGSFLIQAYQVLLDWHRDYYTQEKGERKKGKKDWQKRIYQTDSGEWRLTTAERKRILLNNIYGVDIDPQAVEVTKLSLLLKVLEGESEETLNKQMELFQERALPHLGNNIKCGNSLIDSQFYTSQQLDMLDEEVMYRVNAFDWAKEFPVIMKGGGFDAVIGNPPWGGYLSDEEKTFIKNNYKGFSGNYDTYLFFIEKAIEIGKSAGKFSFITPDTWIRTPQAKKLRIIILEKRTIDSIITLPNKVFKKVSANCTIFLLIENQIHNSCKVCLLQPESSLLSLKLEQFDKSYVCEIDLWKESNDCQFQIYQSPKTTKLILKINRTCDIMENYLDIMQGIVPYSRENHSDEIVNNRLFHSSQKKSLDHGIWIKGKAISRYYLSFENHEFLKYGDWLHRPRKKKYFDEPRILIQEITGGKNGEIKSTYYDSTLYHDPGIISCLNKSNLSILFLLGLINSKFLSWYHKHSSPKGLRKTFPKVLIGDIRNFPVPNFSLDNESYKKIVSLVESMLSLHQRLATVQTDQDRTILQRQIDATDDQINRLVYELYELTEEEIRIVEGEK